MISDHLGVFTDRKGVTVEELVKEKGGIVRKGSLAPGGDIEFWPDARGREEEKHEASEGGGEK